MTRRRNNTTRWIVWVGSIALVGGMLIYSYCQNNNNNGNNNKTSKKIEYDTKYSKCFVVTKSIKDKYNWNRVLQGNSVAILAPNIEIGTIDENLKHKIVVCSLEDSIWPVIKHLKKDCLIISTDDFKEIPNDIPRFVKIILDPTIDNE
ncbi:hypothetical protein TBLA_0A04360 [Henningerozyma blattae CBS 6284]|uniref:Peroxisome assembly protein 22 n=1 Tax=Henningerozyma blattae (strain ATCC 34711 / CBS 6284 / DSM 70876 / NBRC 10599 / NRRL Y-10934 / UCD 77-7) TaxID=1071380 RepID=I2GVS9_HENB6|nr:hypothetical protein TBLA_0A04360 [Tetrapisispora blattae CBS 6284]CCH58231.1 hypothetical protein TBLA_0A04360 [Tetrapisispora blattae CBS 6284]